MFLAGLLTFLAASAAARPRADGRGPRRRARRPGRGRGARSCRPRSRCSCPSSRSRSARPRPAIWGATGAVAAALGPSLGGALVERPGGGWVFFVNLAIGLPARPGAPPPARGARGRTGPAARRRRRRPPRRRGRAPRRSGSSRARTGAGAARASLEALGAAAVAARPASPSAPRVTRRPSSSPRCSACARSRCPTPACSPSRSAFYALLLGNVLFLTGPWHYSVLKAGFAVTPGPLMAAPSAR